MVLEDISIVLVGTTHSGNIGSTARAMKTMGLQKLVLVSPKAEINETTYALASRADDIIANAQIYATLKDALKNCTFVIGTSARSRDISLKTIDPKKCAQKVASFSEKNVAIVFGREHSGLTNEELQLCHEHLVIPSNTEYSSLNISQAVQVISYELRQHIICNPNKEALLKRDFATHQDTELFYEHLEKVLIDIDFLNPDNPKKLMPRLRALFSRANMDKREVSILRGILTNIENSLTKYTEAK